MYTNYEDIEKTVRASIPGPFEYETEQEYFERHARAVRAAIIAAMISNAAHGVIEFGAKTAKSVVRLAKASPLVSVKHV